MAELSLFAAPVKPSHVARNISLAIIVFGAVIIGLLWFLPLERSAWLFYRGEFRTGNQIISRIETFRTTHGRLPHTLQEIGFEEGESGPFYIKINNAAYCVWFGTTLGESETYNSRSKKWEQMDDCIQRSR